MVDQLETELSQLRALIIHLFFKKGKKNNIFLHEVAVHTCAITQKDQEPKQTITEHGD